MTSDPFPPVEFSRDEERQTSRAVRASNRPALIRDIVIVLLVSTAIYLLARRLSMLEAFVSSRHDNQLDEIVVGLALLPLALGVVVGLRWRKSQSALVQSLHSERSLQGSAHRYRELFDSCTSGISRWTLDGKLVIANPAFVNMIGAASFSSELRLAELVESGLLADLLRQVGDSKRIGPAEMQWHVGNRTIDVRLTASRAREVEEGVFDLLTQDITSERSLETQLRHAQKMDAIGRLAGGIAHDFNNLLTVILNEAELAKDEIPAAAPAQAALDGVIRAGERATALTRQLLTFSRRDVVTPTTFAMGDVVNDMARMLRRLIGGDVELGIRIHPDAALVRADRSQIEQVLLNLVVNARDAMPQGGSLVVEAGLRTLDAAYASQHVGVIPGEYAMVSVSDSGMGMTPEVQERLFEPFFTTKTLGQGTGLGLATSFGIVKQAGGHIGVYSEPGKGTTMRVYLPCTLDRETIVAPLMPALRTATRDASILVVEDELGVRQVITRVLLRQGYRVLEASNGMEALRVMGELAEPVDLVISDMVMPDLSGRDLADRITREYPGVKLLFMSGYTDDILLKHQLLESNVPFLQKPFTVKDFSGAVHGVLNDESGSAFTARAACRT